MLRVGFHCGEPAKTDGIGTWIQKMNNDGLGVLAKAVDGTASLFDSVNDINNQLIYRVSQGYPVTGDDVPIYLSPINPEADRIWNYVRQRFDSTGLPKDKVWIETINEPNKDDDAVVDWLGLLGKAIGERAVRDGYKVMLFGWAMGNPEPHHWELPGQLEFLRYAAAHRNQVALSLHEYSGSIDTLDTPHTIGRFRQMIAACDRHSIPHPTFAITEFGWAFDDAPAVNGAMSQMETKLTLYASHPTCLGLSIWALDKGPNWGSLANKVHQFMRDNSPNLHQLWLDNKDIVNGNPDPPDPPQPSDCDPRVPYKRVYHVYPGNATYEQKLTVFNEAVAQNSTVGGSYDDAGHGCGLTSKTAVLWDIPSDQHQTFLDWYDKHYPDTAVQFRTTSTDPLDGIDFGYLFNVPYILTSAFDSPRDYGNGKHEGGDWDITNPTGPDSKEPVLCVYPGIVNRVIHNPSSAYYNYVVVDHEYNGVEFSTWYCHLDAAFVVAGQHVQKGTHIGELGGTGGPWAEHIHFNLQIPGHGLDGYVIADVVDPVPYVPVRTTQPPNHPVGFGLHASANGGDLPSVEIQEFNTLNPDVVKVLSSTSLRGVADLFLVTPNAKDYIVRAFLSWGERNISPQQFINDTVNDVHRTVNTLRANGFTRDIWIELHNEPNLTDEGWTHSWSDGRTFADWLQPVITAYRSAFPTCKLLYPGLSPGAAIPGIRYAHDTFLQQSKHLFSQLDGIGVHAYWSQGWPMGTAVQQLRNYAPFNKPIFVTEASRNDQSRIVSDDQYASEYKQFVNLAGTVPNVRGITYFVSSAIGFDAERWIDGNVSRGLAARIRA